MTPALKIAGLICICPPALIVATHPRAVLHPRHSAARALHRIAHAIAPADPIVVSKSSTVACGPTSGSSTFLPTTPIAKPDAPFSHATPGDGTRPGDMPYPPPVPQVWHDTGPNGGYYGPQDGFLPMPAPVPMQPGQVPVPPSASNAPEPETWALMVIGFGIVCGMMRRRRAVA